MPSTTDKPKRTISPQQKMKMAASGARKAAKEMGLPDPFPNGIPGVDEQKAVTAAPPVTAQPIARPAQLTPTKPDSAPEPIKYGPHDIVRVFNPDDEPFQFRFGTKHKLDGKGKVVDGSIEPITYTLEAGQAIPMHGYMADYVCNHLTSRILQKHGLTRQLNSPIIRKTWATKIILGKEDIITPEAKLSESEQIQKQFEKIQAADQNPVTTDEDEIPAAEASALLDDFDTETAEQHGDGDFPGVNTDPTA